MTPHKSNPTQEDKTMRDFVISVNSTIDMPKEWLAERGIPVLPMKYTIEGETYTDMEGLSSKEFFDRLRAGQMSVTSQVNPEEAKEFYEPFLKEGKDVLHLAFSSGLSGSYNSMVLASRDLAEEYPDAKIIVIDSLCACLGEAVLLQKVLKLREEGKNIEDIAAWVEQNKLNVCHVFTVDDLHHLQRGGSVAKAAATIGTALNVKPILFMNNAGGLEKLGKERGRKKSLNKLVELAVEKSGSWDNDIVMVTHGDCLEDAEYTASQLKEKLGVPEVYVNNIGTVIGTHTGPGIVGVFFMGEKR